MKIYIETKKNKRTLDFKVIARNILIIFTIIIAIKYFNFMDNRTDKIMTQYEQFVQYAQDNNLSITQENYINFLNK